MQKKKELAMKCLPGFANDKSELTDLAG